MKLASQVFSKVVEANFFIGSGMEREGDKCWMGKDKSPLLHKENGYQNAANGRNSGRDVYNNLLKD